MTLKTIDKIKENNQVIFKIKKDQHETLYIDNDIFFLMIKHTEAEYKENKKNIIEKLKIELSAYSRK